MLSAVDEDDGNEFPVELLPEWVVRERYFFKGDVHRFGDHFGDDLPGVVTQVTFGLTDKRDGDGHAPRLGSAAAMTQTDCSPE